MKKNLRNILVLSLGLITTIASAQFSANSTTRIDNSDDENRTAVQRITVGWSQNGITASADLNYDVNGSEASYSIYEAYATTDLFGMTMTAGRQDLTHGSGALMSGNDWGLTRYTNDGISLGMSFSGFDVSVGTLDGINQDNNYMNAGGNFGGADINILMMNDGDNSAHGYDLGYSMMGIDLSYSMNSDYDGDEMTSMGAGYSMGDLGLSYAMTSYDGAFAMNNTAMSGGWTNGVLGYQDAGTEVTSMGLSYELAGISLGYTAHSIDDNGTETDATAISLGYSLNDNAHLGILRIDDNGTESTWLTVKIGL